MRKVIVLFILIPLLIFYKSFSATLYIFLDASQSNEIIISNIKYLQKLLDNKKILFFPDKNCTKNAPINKVYIFSFKNGNIKLLKYLSLDIPNSKREIKISENKFILKFRRRDYECIANRELFYSEITKSLNNLLKEINSIRNDYDKDCPHIVNTLHRIAEILRNDYNKSKYVFILSPMQNKGNNGCPFVDFNNMENLNFSKNTYIYLFMDNRNVLPQALERLEEQWKNYLEELKRAGYIAGYKIYIGYIELFYEQPNSSDAKGSSR